MVNLLEMIEHAIFHAFEDTWTMVFLLYAAYLVIEYFERRDSKDDSLFWNLQKYGPFFGALLGLLPQCGFSILAAMLFCQRNITLGTMLAVFISTSDEAIPVLISEPEMLPTLGWVLVLKLVIAALAGWIIDHLLFVNQKIISFAQLEEESDEQGTDGENELEEEMDEDEEQMASCPCCYPQYPMWLSALIRTAKIYGFVFLVTLAMSLLIEVIGEDSLGAILLQGSLWQPFAAAFFGLIPNCAATVILCQLYVAGTLSFASLLAGLISNAGLGLVVLWQMLNRHKWFWTSLILLLVTSLMASYLLLFLSL